MEEMIHNVLGVLGFILWPIAGIFCVYGVGALFVRGDWRICLISIGIFAALNVAIWALALFAE